MLDVMADRMIRAKRCETHNKNIVVMGRITSSVAGGIDPPWWRFRFLLSFILLPSDCKVDSKEYLPADMKKRPCQFCGIPSLSCISAYKHEGRKTMSEMEQTEQTQRLLRLNNSWVNELNWPWKIPSVGPLKLGTAHSGLSGKTWDRWIRSSMKHYILQTA